MWWQAESINQVLQEYRIAGVRHAQKSRALFKNGIGDAEPTTFGLPITFTAMASNRQETKDPTHLSVVKPHFRYQRAEANIGTKRIEQRFDLEVNELG